ncbi:MAG: type II toxin-antitoxin system HicB family antitoxin [Oxalobacter formigenes]|nr:type II toxin-antitoxin system HicB family antitoxin [Oxalobacter formigenes]
MPYKVYSGRFNLRISPDLHAAAAVAASAQGKSLNTFIADAAAKQV